MIEFLLGMVVGASFYIVALEIGYAVRMKKVKKAEREEYVDLLEETIRDIERRTKRVNFELLGGDE